MEEDPPITDCLCPNCVAFPPEADEGIDDEEPPIWREVPVDPMPGADEKDEEGRSDRDAGEVGALGIDDPTKPEIMSPDISCGPDLREGFALPAARASSGLILCQSSPGTWTSRTRPRFASSNFRLRFRLGLESFIL